MLVRFHIDISGQTLAFERLVSAVRRRAVEIRWLKFGAGSDCSMAQVEFFVEATGGEATRLEANLWKLEETRAITVCYWNESRI
jgi:acetolactate synthase regulatory subunit